MCRSPAVFILWVGLDHRLVLRRENWILFLYLRLVTLLGRRFLDWRRLWNSGPRLHGLAFLRVGRPDRGILFHDRRLMSRDCFAFGSDWRLGFLGSRSCWSSLLRHDYRFILLAQFVHGDGLNFASAGSLDDGGGWAAVDHRIIDQPGVR